MANKIKEEWQNDWAESALSSSIVPVLWLSREAHIIRFNQALIDLLVYNEEDLNSLTLFDLNEELTKKAWKKQWATLSEQKTLLVEAQLINKEDKPIQVELNLSLIHI